MFPTEDATTAWHVLHSTCACSNISFKGCFGIKTDGFHTMYTCLSTLLIYVNVI